jgi:hypothetical protein
MDPAIPQRGDQAGFCSKVTLKTPSSPIAHITNHTEWLENGCRGTVIAVFCKPITFWRALSASQTRHIRNEKSAISKAAPLMPGP